VVLADGTESSRRACSSPPDGLSPSGHLGTRALHGAGVFYIVPSDVRFVEGKDVFVTGAGIRPDRVSSISRVREERDPPSARGFAGEAHVRLPGARDSQPAERRGAPAAEASKATRRQLERLTIADRERGLRETRPASALFVLIGAQPHTEWLADAVQRDAKGFIVTGTDVNTDAADWPLDHSPPGSRRACPASSRRGRALRLGQTRRLGRREALWRCLHP